ncbi:hypothetical protein B0T25DRAFT_80718 [Lasiosphaeria hispida]|uniref:F-box domain-containing protein n=1 Tax=Lasiosphaeria hispida TaxID=260671 RepID=A0AAJ0HP94_9PEZI|nr:hypothetical protein B0T25DRAFT_80718 [Lasiosphaeria hispida]
MKFFKKKEKKKSASLGSFGSGPGGFLSVGPQSSASPGFGHRPGQFGPMATYASAMALAHLPPPVLERIFAFVCPHSQDNGYDACEESSVLGACMLCDMRDLAHCVAVNKRWRVEATKLMYHSIRIDVVHYCDLEDILAEKRKRRSFFDRNGEPEDTTKTRLKLLSRTLREEPVRLGRMVQFLKMPYMLRGSPASQADLARTIAVTPNVRYIDLPEGFFADEPLFMTLRLEVQARCHELRKMTYMSGSEHSLQALAVGNVWRKLEVLELVQINVNPTLIRQVLGNLGNLRALKITDTEHILDETLAWNDMLPPFPALEEFILKKVPNVTAEGIKAWLSMPAARDALRVISLNNTGVHVWALQEVLAHAPALKHMSIIDSVAADMPTAVGALFVSPLNSTSLETLHYEITKDKTAHKYSDVLSSYHNYLANSLLSGGLPNLRAVYVCDPHFPDLLIGLPPPAPGFADGSIARPSSSSSNSHFSPRHSNFNNQSPGFSPMSPPYANSPPFQQQPNPAQQPWAPAHNHRFSSNNPFASMVSTPAPPSAAGGNRLPAKLEVFTKGHNELGWSFVKVPGFNGVPASDAAAGGGRGESGRPLSSYGLGNDVLGGYAAGWRSEAGARRSVFVGGGGGFLAVPGPESQRRGSAVGGGIAGGFGGSSADEDEAVDEWPRPRSSAGETKRERLDLWR